MQWPTIQFRSEVADAANECFVKSEAKEWVGVNIYLDARKLRHRHFLEDLPRRSKLHWMGKPYTFEVQELSPYLMPVTYVVTSQEAWYLDRNKKRQYYTPQMPGIDSDRNMSLVAIRAAVLLAVIGGIGTRRVALLMKMLFHIDIGKSSICRWIEEEADRLPCSEDIVRQLHAAKPITEAHFDEIFPRGRRKKRCVLVLKDEHGRIVATRHIDRRKAEDVKPFLRWLKDLGLDFKTFYIDHCKAYVEAIGDVYPQANIQFDYFHIIQNIWRKLWKAMVSHRKDVKKRSKKVGTAWYKAKLEAQAKRLWDYRHLIFKSDARMHEEERERLIYLMESDPFVSTLRGFLWKVWDIFDKSEDEEEARRRFDLFKALSALQERGPLSKPLGKCVKFLDEHFDNMITYLRVPGVRRNSLAESGMRVLRRLEQQHDGLRTDEGFERFVRLYQSIKYLDWTVHRPPNVRGEALRLAS